MNNKTKNKLVPKLRFQEYRNGKEWTESELGTFAKLIEERAGNSKYISMSVTSGIGLISQKEKFGREISGAQYKNYYVIRKWDFAYNKSATKLYPEGYISMLKEMDAAAVPNSIFTCFRVNKNIVFPQFIDYLFHDNFHGKWLSKFIEVGARAHGSLSIDNIVLLNMPVVFPSPDEQKKIASCLSSLDELIAAENQKLDSLKTHKKGLMQQLFPAEGETLPKLRFAEFKDSGEWEENVLGGKGISIFVKDRTTQIKLKLETYISTENLLADYGGVTIASKLPPAGSFTRFQKGDILISNIRPYLKKVWYANFDGAASNDVIVIRAGTLVNETFLSFLLKNDSFINFVMKGAKGVKMPRGDKSLMEQYPIIFTKKEEQQKIASCLSSLDELIAAQSQKTEALKAHKKGLMQGLFPNVKDSI